MPTPRRARRARQTALGALAGAVLLISSLLSTAPVASARAVPTATTTYGVLLSDYESTLVDGLNARRSALGLGPLRVAGGATDVARSWSRSLSSAGTLTHNAALGPQLDANGSRSWTIAGENVASGGSATSTVDAWMASPAHRANIVNPRFTVVGVGAVTGGGRTWSTTVFADVADQRQPSSTPDGATSPAAPPGAGPAAADPTRVGTLTASGALTVKEGSIYSPWNLLATSVGSYALDGVRVAVVDRQGVAALKEGSLAAGWTTLATGVSGVALAGRRLAVVDTQGGVAIKEGAATSAWTTLWSRGASKVVLSGSRVAVLNGGDLFVKDGAITAGWVLVARQVSDVAMSGDRLAIVTNGTVVAKEGSLSAGWVVLTSGSDVGLSGNRIGVLDSGNALVKEGMFGSWTLIAGREVRDLSLAGSRVAVVSGTTVSVKEGSLSAGWVTLTSGVGVTLSR